MSDLNYNPDDEMAKYIDAYDLLQANVPVDKMPNSPRKFNPMTGSNDVLTQMENGGYIVVGSEPFVMSQPPTQIKDQSINQDVALNVGPQTKDTDVLQVESAQSYANELKERFGSFNKEELKAAGYSDQVIESAFPARQDLKPVTPPEPRTEEISQEEVAERISKGEAFFMPNDTLRERGTSLVNEFFFDRAVDALRDELQEQGMSPDQIEREIQARTPEFMRNAEVYSNALFGTGATGFEIGAADFLSAGAMDIQEGYRLFSANMPGKGDSILGRTMGMGLMAAGIAEATGVGYGFGKLLKKGIDKLRPTLARMGADAEARIENKKVLE